MTYQPAIASMSLGRAWVHQLPGKLDEAAKQRFQGIEIFYEDLEYESKRLFGETEGLSDEHIVETASKIRILCEERSLVIIGLQPFLSYEGLVDREEHRQRIVKLKLWFRIAKALNTDIIQIPSNFLQTGTTGDFKTIVGDMLEVAELGLQQTPVIRFAYENLCFGTHIDTWKGAWDVVAAVDRPNFGMCLDTFNIAGREWADPSRADGKLEDADERLKRSITEMKKTIDIKRVFYVQVVDAEKMRNPLVPGHAFHVDGQPSRMSWSRNARLFPFEEGSYLPILDVLRAITESDGLDYKGWISMELFSRTMAEPEPSVPAEHARRAMVSWKKLVEVLKWH